MSRGRKDEQPDRCLRSARASQISYLQAMTGSTTARGYGNAHQKTRRRWAIEVARGTACCARCRGIIYPSQPWELDHRTGKNGYLGPSHKLCNRRAGGKLGAAVANAKKGPAGGFPGGGRAPNLLFPGRRRVFCRACPHVAALGGDEAGCMAGEGRTSLSLSA
jgi:hypothetical protein